MERAITAKLKGLRSDIEAFIKTLEADFIVVTNSAFIPNRDMQDGTCHVFLTVYPRLQGLEPIKR